MLVRLTMLLYAYLLTVAFHSGIERSQDYTKVLTPQNGNAIPCPINPSVAYLSTTA